MIGITKFLKEHMQSNIKFSPPPLINKSRPPAEQRVRGKDAGLRIGRYTDILFRKIVDKATYLDPHNMRHRRCSYMFEALRKNNIVVSKTQVRVKCEEINTHTLLDGLGVTKDGHPVVIELKTTQYTLSEHERRYNNTCRIKPKLNNGLPNSEFILHGLQAAFGALALQQEYVDCTKPIKAIVIVAASDGAKSYWVNQQFIDTKLFQKAPNHSIARELTTSLPDKQKFLKWPTNATLDSLKACFESRGYSLIEENKRKALSCSGIAYAGSKTQPSCIAVVGVYHHVYQQRLCPQREAIYKRNLRNDAKRIHSQLKKKVPVHLFLVCPMPQQKSFAILTAGRPVTTSPR